MRTLFTNKNPILARISGNPERQRDLRFCMTRDCIYEPFDFLVGFSHYFIFAGSTLLLIIKFEKIEASGRSDIAQENFGTFLFLVLQILADITLCSCLLNRYQKLQAAVVLSRENTKLTEFSLSASFLNN